VLDSHQASADETWSPAADHERLIRHAVAVILGMTALRFAVAVLTPLHVDEAYYWTWSEHLAAGYYDHPPLVAYVIRLGTLIVGNTELGVRLISILLALPMSWAVYRAGAILLDSVPAGVTAAIMLNATMMVSFGVTIVSPDAPLMLACSLVLLALAKVWQTGRGEWWLAAGAAAGLALLAKLNGFFVGLSILIWLIGTPNMRRWLWSPWPYAGGILAFALFAPTILWNMQHDWTSFTRQLSRAIVDGFRPKFLLEFLGGQVLVATPIMFGASGVWALLKGGIVPRAGSVLINAMILPVVIYYTLHALHGGVHPNWLAQIYPAFAIASAAALHRALWSDRYRRVLDGCNRWAVPSSIALFILAFFQINTGVLTAFHKDPGAHVFAVGFKPVAEEIERLRAETGASCILTSDFGTTSWFAFYLPQTCVAQRDERIRWADVIDPEPSRLNGKLVFVATDLPAERFDLGKSFASIQPLAHLTRYRGRTPIQTYEVVLLDGAKGDVFDRTLPPGVAQ
jgi:hypothetical protein